MHASADVECTVAHYRWLRYCKRVLLWLGGIAGMIYLCAWVRLTAEQSMVTPQGVSVFLHGQDLWALADDGTAIWAGGRYGLYCIDQTLCQPVPLPHGAPDLRMVSALLYLPEQGMWIAHARGVTCWNGSQWLTVARNGDELPGRPRTLTLDADGNIWIGCTGGVTMLSQGGEITLLPIPDIYALPTYDVICHIRNGTTYLGCDDPHDGGLITYSDSGWQSLSTHLPHPSVNAILQTGDGTLWVGTGFAAAGCAMRYDGRSWNTLRKSDGLAGEKVRSLMQDDRGRLWFGAEYDGLAVRQDQRWAQLSTQDGLAGPEVKAMLQDTSGVVWLATTGGLTRLDATFMKGLMRDL